jgi:hypothetical protein
VPELEQWLSDAACEIRRSVEAPKFKEYVLPAAPSARNHLRRAPNAHPGTRESVLDPFPERGGHLGEPEEPDPQSHGGTAEGRVPNLAEVS